MNKPEEIDLDRRIRRLAKKVKRIDRDLTLFWNQFKVMVELVERYSNDRDLLFLNRNGWPARPGLKDLAPRQ